VLVARWSRAQTATHSLVASPVPSPITSTEAPLGAERMLLARASPVGEAVGVVEACPGVGVAEVEGSVEVLGTVTDAEVAPETVAGVAHVVGVAGTRY